MKQLKTLALFTVLFVVSACSTSGNDTKNNGTDGGTGGNGGGSDAFLTAISKYSKMTGTLNGGNADIIIGDGKTLVVMDMQNPASPQEMSQFTYVKFLSGAKAEYSQKNFTPDSATIIEIDGTSAKITDSFYGQGTVTLTLIK